MSMKYLGTTIDIHGGGLENQFPHHDCEIAQSEAANASPFVRFWLHNNMVTVDGQKMGKSLNNFITLKQIFTEGHERLSRTYDPPAVRQLILQSHYRSPIDFSDASLTAAQSGYEKIRDAVVALRKRIKQAPQGEADMTVTSQIEGFETRFVEAMNDDLNTAVGLSVLFDLVRLTAGLLENEKTSLATLKAVEEKFRRLGGEVLGVVQEDYPQASSLDEALLDHLVGVLIDQRKQAKAEKDYAAADAIRDRLAEFGIALEDKPGGVTVWRRK